MATAVEVSCVTRIGEVAGGVYRHLEVEGPTSLSKLVKEIDAPRDIVMQSLGWLAREDKINIDEESRSKIVSLR